MLFFLHEILKNNLLSPPRTVILRAFYCKTHSFIGFYLSCSTLVSTCPALFFTPLFILFYTYGGVFLLFILLHITILYTINILNNFITI